MSCSIYKMRRRGQTSTEFVILTTFMMTVFIVFFVLIEHKMVVINDERTDISAQNIENIVVTQVRLAESVSDNYYNEFVIPNNINGFNYTIQIMQGVSGDTELVIKYNSKERVYFFDEHVTNDSQVHQGLNRIEKNDGAVKISTLS